MSKIVFVLGAGASAHCGTPLMNNFLEVAEDLWRIGKVTEAWCGRWPDWRSYRSNK